MAKWEREALNKYPLRPFLYFRFLDDIFMIWTYSEEQFWELFNVMNSHHPSIKLKATVSETSVNFLDTTVFKYIFDKTLLCTKVFFKPTDTHALLHKSSFHPKTTFRGIIKSQILRFNRICSLVNDSNDACALLFKALQKRNYSKRMLRQIRTEILNETASANRVGQELAMPGNSNWGNRKCALSFACLTCKATRTCENFISGRTKLSYPINSNLGCSADNMVYLISCLCCPMQYVGQTERALRYRFCEHRRAMIRRDDSNAVAKHFIHYHPDYIISDNDIPVIITPIEKILDQGSKDANKAKRLDREQFWIDTLVTYVPYGMNEDAMSIKDRNEKKGIIPFIVPFCKTGREAANIAKKYFTKIQEKLEDIFDQRIIIAYQKHKNLKDILVSTKV